MNDPRCIRSRLLACALEFVVFICGAGPLSAQVLTSGAHNSKSAETSVSLEQRFFTAIKTGDSAKVLSFIPRNGVNVGPQAHHVTYADVEQQFQMRRGLYCRLFDSSCIATPIKLDNSARPCAYRALLIHSETRTAATETTRNGVKQAILVARIKNDQCPDDKLIDFIFNLDADGWKLFSIP